MESFKRTIVVGDVHGCVDELRALLADTGFLPGTDRVILAGDLIDRGPDPAAVVRLARSIDAEVLMGNHEEKAIRWRTHVRKKLAKPEYEIPMKPPTAERAAQWAAIPDADWEWLATRPKFLHINSVWSVAHAGAMPDVAMESQDPQHLMRIRYINPMKMKAVSPTPVGEQPEGCKHWTDLYKGPRKLVYGHYTYDEVKKTQFTLGIDTGCYHGGLLTAAVFNSPANFGPSGMICPEDHYVLHQVAANRVYHPRGWGADSV